MTAFTLKTAKDVAPPRDPACSGAHALPVAASEAIQPFELHIAEDDVADLRRRLVAARLPQGACARGWEAGTSYAVLAELLVYWCNGFDWRARERAINRHPQFTTSIDGEDIHFHHLRSPGATRALLMLHGWPSASTELLDVAERLASGPDAPDIVVPSLPGYALAGPLRTTGWDLRRIAAALATLMKRLGYASYVVHGGDWGAMIGDWLGATHGGAVTGLYSTMACAPRIEGELAPDEAALVAADAAFHAVEGGYSLLQGTKPQSLAVALTDSPAGLCAWFLEKFWTWTGGTILSSPEARDSFLTIVSLHWFFGTAGSAGRLYYEFFHADGGRFNLKMFDHLPARVPVPTAVARFPGEVLHPPRAWVERRYDLVQWTDMPSGGHFPAIEQPVLLAEDLRRFLDRVSPAR